LLLWQWHFLPPLVKVNYSTTARNLSRTPAERTPKVAEKFGRTISLTSDLKKAVEDTVNNIRLQVQHLNKNEEPKPVFEMYFRFSSATGDKTTVVNAVGTTHLKFFITQSKLLEPDMVKLLSDAILDMISDTDNIIGNKIALIECLKELGTKFPKDVAVRVFEVLESIILDKIGCGICKKMSEEAANPMNPYKFDFGSPSELKGFALYALAYMESRQPGLFDKKLYPLIENALLDVDPEIRKHAFAASREILKLSDKALIGVLFGTRDSDAKAATWAFDSIISKKSQKFSKYHFHLLYYSIVMAAKSPNAELRRMAAIVIKNFSDILPTVAPKIKEIEKDLLDDVCYSVRSVLE
jgi:hypothetical protein